MTLSTLNWRRLANVNVTVSTAAGVLDHLWSVLAPANTVYYDGSARTAGSGSAATWSRYQNAGTTEALYATPATNTLTIRWILAGVNAARTPLMASPDTYTANVLMGSINKNSGAFASWDSGTAPFTSGSFFGYWKWWNAGGVAGKTIYAFECQEAVAVFIEDTGGAVYGFLIGAYLDPMSSDTTFNAESDGKLYGLIASGSSAITAAFNTAGGSTASSNNWMSHSTSAANSHVGIFTPGAGTLITLYRTFTPSVSTTTNFLMTNGDYSLFPPAYSNRTGNQNTIGQLRSINMGIDGLMGNVFQTSGVDVAYLAGGSTSATQDVIWLMY